MAQSDRDILFANETFLIGVLQAVSGGSLVAALSQSETLVKLSGRILFVSFLTVMALSLLAAVLAAYWKHDYKMWDLKSALSARQGNVQEAERRHASFASSLGQMRWAMKLSVLGIVVGYGILVAAIWYHAL